MQRGESPARDELLHAVSGRFERLARKMLRQFPGVASFEQTGDVVQNASLRLMKALEEVRPGSIRELMGLAAVQIRRELVDLARHYQGRNGGRPLPVREADVAIADGQTAVAFDAVDVAESETETWESLHLAVEQLSPEEREVFSLVFYHGWTQPEIAELFQVTDRTVRRWWQSACLNLSHALGGHLPPSR